MKLILAGLVTAGLVVLAWLVACVSMTRRALGSRSTTLEGEE